jgi:hypothetical protein
VLTDLPFKLPAKTYARIGGALYLIVIAIGLWGEAFVREKLIVSGDAAATSANIKSMQSLWRFAIGAEIILLLFAVTSTWIFLLLMRPVSADQFEVCRMRFRSPGLGNCGWGAQLHSSSRNCGRGAI